MSLPEVLAVHIDILRDMILAPSPSQVTTIARDLSEHLASLTAWVEPNAELDKAVKALRMRCDVLFHLVEQTHFGGSDDTVPPAQALAIAGLHRLEETLKSASPSDRAKTIGVAWKW